MTWLRRGWQAVSEACGQERLMDQFPVVSTEGLAHSASPARRWPQVLVVALLVLSAALLLARLAVNAFASPPAALSLSTPALVDDQYPYGSPFGFNSLSCASTTLCVGTTKNLGQLVSSTNPTGTSPSDWSVLPTKLISHGATGYALSGASCVTVTSGPFCLAAGRDPNAGAAKGVILTSSHPQGDATDWTPTAMPDSMTLAPSCAPNGGAATVCVTGGYHYDLTTDTGGPVL